MQKLYFLCKGYYCHDFLASKCHVLVRKTRTITGYRFDDQVLISACGRDFFLQATVCSRRLWDSLNPHWEYVIVIVMIYLNFSNCAIFRNVFLLEWREFPSAPCLEWGVWELDDNSRLVVVEMARVAWHASFQPLWQEKTCNSAHRPLFPTKLSIPSGEIGK
jgi:hypothetical protein